MKIQYKLLAFLLAANMNVLAQKPAGVVFTDADYIVVWHCGGMASFGNHGFIWCYTIAGLSCDTTHPHCFSPGDISQLDLARLPAEAFAKLNDMPSSITPEMLQGSARYGKQEIDGGDYYVLASINGATYHWGFTGPLDKFPPEAQKFASYIYNKL